MVDQAATQHLPSADLSRSNTIIAIGGAKGGIGKSVFCANLGVYFSTKRQRTILVDLDLGGANLHLFLGIWSLEHRLQDFLDKKCDSLEAVLVKTPYGPHLAGGGGGKLGAAHIPFVQKLKLIRALKSLPADYTLIDLGGDTTFNSLDYFLTSDIRIVLTTCDPASYLDAYNFIKMALYRRLMRIFGPENHSGGNERQRDPGLLATIETFVNSGLSGSGARIDSLLDEISTHHPRHLKMVLNVLDQLRPHVVVNMVTDFAAAEQLAERFIKVSERMLSLKLNYIGAIAYGEDIKKCTLDLVPHTIRHPNGTLYNFFDHINPVIQNYASRSPK